MIILWNKNNKLLNHNYKNFNKLSVYNPSLSNNKETNNKLNKKIKKIKNVSNNLNNKQKNLIKISNN